LLVLAKIWSHLAKGFLRGRGGGGFGNFLIWHRKE